IFLVTTASFIALAHGRVLSGQGVFSSETPFMLPFRETMDSFYARIQSRRCIFTNLRVQRAEVHRCCAIHQSSTCSALLLSFFPAPLRRPRRVPGSASTTPSQSLTRTHHSFM